MSHVFISYVHDNALEVQRLRDILRTFNVEVWLDRDQLKPGYRWADAIREAIRDGTFYIACFSKAYNERMKTYMNEELTIAIEELRQRPTDQSWFIPVLLDKSEVPNRSIGAGETLRSLQWVNLYQNWSDGVRRLLSVIDPNSARIYELIQALTNASARVRIKAADDLGVLGELAVLAVPSLAEALGDSNETVRAAAAEALGKIGVTNEQVIEKLLATMEKAEVYYDSEHAADALAKLGRPGMLALLKATRFEGYAVGDKAAEALAYIGQPAVAFLLEMVNADSIDAAAAVRALDDIADPAAVPELMQALHHKDGRVRAAAASALGRAGEAGDRAVIAALRGVIDDEDEQVREGAAFALRRLADTI